MFLIYNLMLALLAPIWVPWMWFRSRKRKESVNWRERFGRYQIPPPGKRVRVWFHAVSVGEVIAAKPILERLKAADAEVVLSVTTSSGHQTAREKLPQCFDHLIYFPIDILRFQYQAMTKVQPKVVAIMETELWLNFLWSAKAIGAKTLLVNGRKSDGSFRSSMRLRPYYVELFKRLDACLAQSETDAERFTALGAPEVEVLGNVKFDQAVDHVSADMRALREKFGVAEGRLVLVVGSTRDALEEEWVVGAVAAVGLHNLSVIHAPRHLERVPELRALIESKIGSCAQRSLGEHADYTILDTYGDLQDAYGLADVAIVGGGFSNLGGQNLIQPLALGKPVLHGAHMHNFREAAREALEMGASFECGTKEDLQKRLAELLGDMHLRVRMGEAARQMVDRHRGAAARYAEAILGAATKRPKDNS